MSAASFSEVGIELPRLHGQQRIRCPQCDSRRDDLSVDADRGLWLCFRCGWKGRISGQSTWNAEYLQRAQEAERRRAEDRSQAAVEAQKLWANAKPCLTHEYLRTKHILPCGIRVSRSRLVIPMRAEGGRLRNCQTITEDGTKRFIRGGQVKATYFAIGAGDGPIHVCEGFATGAALHLYFVPHGRIAVAFTCGNLKPVAKLLRAKHPDADLIIAADDDRWTPGNPGITHARQAALATGARLMSPDFDGMALSTKPTDFADLYALRKQHESTERT
jgi:putative DNA primase/helicase